MLPVRGGGKPIRRPQKKGVGGKIKRGGKALEANWGARLEKSAEELFKNLRNPHLKSMNPRKDDTKAESQKSEEGVIKLETKSGCTWANQTGGRVRPRFREKWEKGKKQDTDKMGGVATLLPKGSTTRRRKEACYIKEDWEKA